jgi:hypothetical protein
VLVQGAAESPDEVTASIEGFESEVRRVFRRQPASGFYSGNPITRYLFDWYYMRLVIHVTPRCILWWPKGDFWQAPLEVTVWDEILTHLASFESAVLTGLDGEGHPCSVRCQPYTDPVRQMLRMRLPAGVPVQPGPASLLCHVQDGNMRNLKSFLVRGELGRDARSWSLRPQGFVPEAGIGGPMGMVRFLTSSRRNATRYLKKRELPRLRVSLGGDRDDQGMGERWAVAC